MPKPLRDALQAQSTGGFTGVYVYPLFKVPALEACGEEFMQRIAQSLDDLDMFSEEQDDLASVLLENAHTLPFDPEGRVVLPEELLRHAGIEGEALFVGRGVRFQIWNAAAYEKHRGGVFDRMRTKGATLPLRPSREGQA